MGQTGDVLTQVDEALASVQTDLNALQSSEMYQKLTSLEGLDADSIADFMSSPVSIKSNVLYDVENLWLGNDTILHKSCTLGRRTDSGINF